MGKVPIWLGCYFGQRSLKWGAPPSFPGLGTSLLQRKKNTYASNSGETSIKCFCYVCSDFIAITVAYVQRLMICGFSQLSEDVLSQGVEPPSGVGRGIPHCTAELGDRELIAREAVCGGRPPANSSPKVPTISQHVSVVFSG